MRRRCLALAFLLPAGAAAAADDLFGELSRPAPTIPDIRPFERAYQPPDEITPKPKEPEERPFGAKGTQYAVFGGGWATNLNEANDVNLRVAWSYFVIENVEFSTELNGWFFNQPGDDAIGINPAFVFRWHFITRPKWSIFTDAGIGVLFSSDDVPDGGTSFNFTPRFGGGFTYALDDSGTRLQLGIRWHHISNARLRGDSDNPARDGVMLYAGVMIPF